MFNSIILICILVAIYYCIQNNKKNTETFIDTDKIYFDDPYSLNDMSIPENNDPLKVSCKDMELLKDLNKNKIIENTNVKPYKKRTHFSPDGNVPEKITFNYTIRPEDKEFLKEQKDGVNLSTWYNNAYIEKLDDNGKPIWGSREKETGKKDLFIQEHTRQSYEFNQPKSRHNDATIAPNAALNTKISEVYDNFFVNYKKLTPEKTKEKVEADNIVAKGASNLTFFAPDTWAYNDEKPENGGMIENGLYAADVNNLNPVAIF